MDMVHPAIESYLAEFSRDPDPVLKDLEEHAAQKSFRTEDGRTVPFPVVGPVVGRVLQQLARLAEARRVMELGSGFGYSAYWFARGIGPAGEIVLTDGSPENLSDARKFLSRMSQPPKFRFEEGEALGALDRLQGNFDIVFLDLDKQQYAEAFRRAWPRVRPGGLLLADNALWSGEVLEPGKADPACRGILDFTALIRREPGCLATILPVRDGLAVCHKARP